MPKIKYINKTFRTASLALITKCNVVLRKYATAGYDMTLRQLYYQLVAADEIPNTPASYNQLGALVNDARLAGHIDWLHIVDRTRNLKALAHWASPAELIAEDAACYRIDKWATQPYRPEVWIEKEALAGVFERICQSLDVPFFSCRGYTSASEMWLAAQRLKRYEKAGQTPIIFHFGDHDPSGIDMTRDIDDRLDLFMGGLKVERLALNMPQIEEYQPPPNPAKITDTRAAKYIDIYGDESWELDALPPDTLAGLVRDHITGIRNETKWQAALDEERHQRATLRAIDQNFDQVERMLDEDGLIEAAKETDDSDDEDFDDADE
jgi:hypothetical protein